MPSPLALAIFDCDGVLVDSEIIAAHVESDMFREIGYEISPEELAHRFAGLTLTRIVELVKDESGIAVPENFVARVEAENDVRLGRDVVAIPGVGALLDAIDLPRCICSNSSSARLEMMLRHVGLWDRFRPFVFAAREVGSGKVKPAPDVFLHACTEFGVEPSQAVVIEDSVHGAAAAVAAGCRVVGFTGASHTYPGHAEALEEAGAETVINRLADYPAVVGALSSWRG
ncbi:HAD family hydrolase [Aureimonas sp. Leaf454]|uniref:HAD family hydrolase n=1 Tax=Aureimonas sp. Leaf454 TaxID=1736381 RepID=UPI0006FEA72B|nr:HAD family phosphatase [Aureimonas sp. Leaf454]KQT54688.1 HAD family hydrolase [Aureimonas sp. Leaf454]